VLIPPLHLRSPVWFDVNFTTIISLVSELPSSSLSGEFKASFEDITYFFTYSFVSYMIPWLSRYRIILD